MAADRNQGSGRHSGAARRVLQLDPEMPGVHWSDLTFHVRSASIALTFGKATRIFQTALAINALILASAVSQTTDGTGSDTGPALQHLSLWTRPTPAPENAFTAVVAIGVQALPYCEPVSLQPVFRTEVTRNEAEIPGDFDPKLNGNPDCREPSLDALRNVVPSMEYAVAK